MKKIYTIITICAITAIFAAKTQAQIIQGETFLGFNLSQIDGDKAYGYKRIGLHGGIGTLTPVYRNGNLSIDIALEIAFNQRGSHQRQQFNETENGITGEYDVYMNYLEIPLLIYLTDKQITSLGLGASYGRLIKLREFEHGVETPVNLDYEGEDKYKLNDWCFLADLKFRIHERWKLGIRYQYSILPIRERSFELVNGEPDLEWQNVPQYNNVVTARLIYVINEDRSQYIYDRYQFTGDNPKIHQKAIDRELKKLKKQQEKKEKKAAK